VKFISRSWEHLFNVPNYITEREKATPAVGINFFIRKEGILKIQKATTIHQP